MIERGLDCPTCHTSVDVLGDYEDDNGINEDIEGGNEAIMVDEPDY